jgi:hypothetical protein
MFNYQGLLNPSQFPQQQMAPQGASYWMQYAQPPQPLQLPPQMPPGGPAAPPTGGPAGPGTPTPPGTPPRPPGPAHGGDSGWGWNRPRPNQGGNNPIWENFMRHRAAMSSNPATRAWNR